MTLIAATLGVAPTPTQAAPVACGGVVFHDYDADGERNEDYSFVNDADASGGLYGNELDPGVAGLTVTVTTSTGATQVSTTDANGVWQVTVDDTQFPVSVEVSNLPSGFAASTTGVDSGPLTQFLASASDCAGPFDGNGSTANVGVVNEGTFCENRPDFIESCFLFGNIANHDDMPAVVSVQDGTQDDNAEADWMSPGYTQLATLGDVGTVWGNGYDRTTGNSYFGSFVKRHTRLKGNPTTIFRITPAGVSTPWFTTDPTATDPHTATADAAALGLSNPLDGWMYDFGAFDDVGKAGLGDVEVSADGSHVYTVDLGSRELVVIPIQPDGSAGTATRIPITAAALGVPGGTCAASDIRPFGLGTNDAGLLHVGVVCSAESTVAPNFTPITSAGPALGDSSKLAGWVYSIDPAASTPTFTEVTDVPLPLTSRGGQAGAATTDFSAQAQWRPWVDRMPYAPADLPSFGNTYGQPMISDIEFDGDDMVIGIMDRWAHQTGANAFYEDWANATQPNPGFASEQPISSGDLVRANWTGSDYSFPTTGVDFTYVGDNYTTSHLETAIGAMAQIPGRPYVVAASFDPNEAANTWQSGGIEWFDNATGVSVNGVRLYNGRPLGIDVGTFEKAAGIGDLQAACSTAPIQIGNRVWFDTDGDGIQDPGEPPMAGITVELLDGTTVIDTTTTDANGEYYFDDVAADTTLTIRLAQTNYDAGGVFAAGGTHDNNGGITVADAGSDDELDADAMLVNDLPSITVNVSQSDHRFDFGMVQGGVLRLGNRVWLDTDGDGSQNGAEPGITGVEVQLWSVTGGLPDTMLETDTTDADGRYFFENLLPGDYIVAIADTQQATGQPLAGLGSTTGNGVAPDPDNSLDLDDNGDPTSGFASISRPVMLANGTEPVDELDEGGWINGDSNLTVDFGFLPALELGNLVWFDTNNSGTVDPGETPAPGVTINLLSGAGAQLASTTTDGSGHYNFAGLTPGSYRVEIPASQFASGAPLDGWLASTGTGVSTNPNDDTDNNSDGAANAGAVRSGLVTLAVGAEPTNEVDESTTGTADTDSNLSVDFGVYRTYRIGNLVWFDANNNGIADIGEASIEGANVQLWTAAGGVPVTMIDTASTNANGRYLFEDLLPGEYIVAIPDSEQATGAALEGMTTSTGNDPAPDPDGGSDNDDNGSATSGFAAISSALTLDSSTPTGEVDGRSGAADEDGSWTDTASDLTVDFGFIGSLRLGNRVWLDTDGNGSQNGTEPGIPGVEVQLWSVTGGNPDAIVATTTTDTDGRYLFENLATGDYVVAIADTQQAAGQPLAGLGSTTGNGVAPGPDNSVDLDDNGDPAPGFAAISRAVTLMAGTEPAAEVDEAGWTDLDSNLTVDFGFLPGLELGNLVWFDTNNSGTVDPGEPPAPGVSLQLLHADGTVAGSATTDANGHYNFAGLAPGTYIVEVATSQFATNAPLYGWYPSTGTGVSSNPNDNTDSDSNGSGTVGVVRSGPVTLVVGTEPTNEVDESTTGTADVDSNLSVDFGFYQVSLGDLVWLDDNNNGLRDAGEAPAPGVTVVLLNEAGDPVVDMAGENRTTVTDTNGNYRFDGLPEGTYILEIPASNTADGGPLAGRASSSGNDLSGIAPDPDNDLNDDDNGTFHDGGRTRSAPVTLAAGTEPGGSDNPTVDFGFTPSAGLGAKVWIDTDGDGTQDAGEPGVPGVIITVYSATTGEVVGTAVSDSNGGWTVEGLPPGDYYVDFRDPAGRTFTRPNTGGDGTDSDVSVLGRTQVITLGIGEYDGSIAAGLIPTAATPVVPTTPNQPSTNTAPPSNRLPFTGTSAAVMAVVAMATVAAGWSLLILRRKHLAQD